MKLEDIIRKQLAEATAQLAEATAELSESKKTVELKEPTEAEEVGGEDKVELKPTMKKDKETPVKEEVVDEESIDESNTVHTIYKTHNGRKSVVTGTLQDLIKDHQYTLDTGKSYEGEKGNKKIDTNPKNIESLVKHLNAAKDNANKTGSSSTRFSLSEEVADEENSTVKPSRVSEQVAALLEAEGLSEDFKLQAVTIFEAAVTDRVLQIQEELKQDFDVQLAEAKAQMETDIDGFLSEAVAKWHEENEVAIKTNFNTQVAESFMDGLSKLIAEHNIEVPAGKEDALMTALSEVDKLNEELKAREDEVKAIQETVKQLEAGKILESYKEKMTSTEFDRFTQLTESVAYATEDQYKKQLNIVLENFGSKQKTAPVSKPAEIISEEVIGATKVETIVHSNVAKYAAFLSKK